MNEHPLTQAPKLRRDTVTGYVYETIRERIMKLDFQPGQTLSEKEIALSMGVSRTPVRESFIRLERQGLLCIFPQRGTYVSLISQSRILEERFFRETLEIAIFKEYLTQHDSQSIDTLKHHIELQHQAYLDGDYYESLQQDDAFHHVFYDATSHPLCAYIKKSYSTDYQRVRLLSILDASAINEVNFKQHDYILDAIISGDHQLAIKNYTDHICKLNTEMERILTTYPTYFQN